MGTHNISVKKLKKKKKKKWWKEEEEEKKIFFFPQKLWGAILRRSSIGSGKLEGVDCDIECLRAFQGQLFVPRTLHRCVGLCPRLCERMGHGASTCVIGEFAKL